jgi:hypothetical protein
LTENEPQGSVNLSRRMLDRRQPLIRGGGLVGAAGLMPLLAARGAGKDPAKCYIGSSEGGEEGAQAMLKGSEYVKTIELPSLKKLGCGVVELPLKFFKTGTDQNLIVHSPLLHYGENAKLEAVLKEYE